MAFQLFHVDQRLWIFTLRASVLELISSMRLDGTNDIQYVKSAWSVLHADVKACVLPRLQGTMKDVKRTQNHRFLLIPGKAFVVASNSAWCQNEVSVRSGS